MGAAFGRFLLNIRLSGTKMGGPRDDNMKLVS